MNSSQPFVSVITPCYNGADFIGECIESVLKQTYTNFEYILVNNCSKDNTLQIMRDYAARDSRIKVHDNTDFLDVMVNHNHAMRLMSEQSKHCKCVSADDWIFPDCLRQMVELAEAHPTVGVVGSYSLEGSRVLFEGLDYSQKVVNGREICHQTLTGKLPYVFGAPTTLLYRADLIRSVKEFFPYAKGAPHADMSAVYQALQSSDFGFVHQVLSFTRVHAASETSSSFKYGRINRALLADMARFGPVYLTPEEQRLHLGIATDKYYAWLVAALLENNFDKAFLEGQRQGLKAIGFELSTPLLLKAGLLRGVELLEHPSQTTQKLSAMLRRKGKIVARGTNLT
jgi:glycosyltransferase involved in cell wall biosynthesis